MSKPNIPINNIAITFSWPVSGSPPNSGMFSGVGMDVGVVSGAGGGETGVLLWASSSMKYTYFCHCFHHHSKFWVEGKAIAFPSYFFLFNELRLV